MSEKPLATKTCRLYAENLDRYLGEWKGRSLESLGVDRAGFRAHNHGLAVASQTLRCFRAAYNYHRKVMPELPECPGVAVELPSLKPRDWALSDDELRRWWAAVQKLSPLKRAFWLTPLLTGARRDSRSHLALGGCGLRKETDPVLDGKGRPLVQHSYA